MAATRPLKGLPSGRRVGRGSRRQCPAPAPRGLSLENTKGRPVSSPARCASTSPGGRAVRTRAQCVAPDQAATSRIEKNRAPARHPDRSRRLSAGQRRRWTSRNAGHAAASHRTALKPLSLRERGWGEGASRQHPVLIGPVTRSRLPRGERCKHPRDDPDQAGQTPFQRYARGLPAPHVILIVRAGSAPASEDAGYPGIPATQQRSRGRTQSLSASGTGRVAATPS